jgi:hypothetical protein
MVGFDAQDHPTWLSVFALTASLCLLNFHSSSLNSHGQEAGKLTHA